MRVAVARSVLAVIVATTGVFRSDAGAQETSSIQAKLVGTWRLVSLENVREGEPSQFSYGLSPKGTITYTADGHMVVHLVDPDRPRLRAADATADDLRALLRTHGGYFGTYTVDEQKRTVTHHRQGSVVPADGDLVRTVLFTGNRLILSTLETVVEGKKRFSRITWERLGPAEAVAPYKAASRAPVVGTWRLVRHETTMANGEVRRNYGETPRGLFLFSADGHATVQITNATRPTVPLDKASLDELRAITRSYLAYFGTYDVDEANQAIFIHTVDDLNPMNTGADQKRFFTFEGDRMILSPPPVQVNGGQQMSRITWERVK